VWIGRDDPSHPRCTTNPNAALNNKTHTYIYSLCPSSHTSLQNTKQSSDSRAVSQCASESSPKLCNASKKLATTSRSKRRLTKSGPTPQLLRLHRPFVAVCLAGAMTHSLSWQMTLTCLNNMNSAYVVVTLHAGFFEHHQLVDDTISCRVMLKATPRTALPPRLTAFCFCFSFAVPAQRAQILHDDRESQLESVGRLAAVHDVAGMQKRCAKSVCLQYR
jgi:hypothetical protein